MKTIIFYTALVAILSGGIYYYVQSSGNMDSTVTSSISAPVDSKNIKSLTETISITHPKWTDNLVGIKDEPGRVKRERQGDEATIVELTDNSITISWDNWGVEQFDKGANGKYVPTKK